MGEYVLPALVPGALVLGVTTSPALTVDEPAPPGRGPRLDREAFRLSGRG